jgi:carboxyl-terminal processing protease
VNNRFSISAAAALLSAVALFALGYFSASLVEEPAQSQGFLDEAVEVIFETSAQEVDRDTLRSAAIDGMLKSLGDRWSQYFPSGNTRTFKAAVEGSFSGVGVWLRNSELEKIQIVAVVPGSSAETAGVLVGDYLIAVDGKKVEGLTLGEVTAALTDNENSTARLSLETDNQIRAVSVTRQNIEINPVTISTLASGVTVIKISDFARGTARDVRSALATQIGERTGVVLDLRGNSGGLVTEAVEVAGTFLNGGAVVEFHKANTAPQILKASAQGDGVTPLVILVDAATASAAEIVAAALQDRSRAVIVGENTYGKAAVQDVKTLSDGSIIELTVGYYVTPNGNRIDGVGVAPDIFVARDDENISAESRALQVLDGLVAAAATRG